MVSRRPPEDLAANERAVRAYLSRRLHGSEVEDAAQTVMQRALERRDAYESAERPRAWLLGVARNVALEVLRARAKAPVPASEEELSDPSIAPAPTAEDRIHDQERSSLLYRALADMRLEDQLALLLTYVDGASGPEAAEIMGVSFAAFRQRLSRARRQAEKRIRELAGAPRPVDPTALRAWEALLAADDPSAGACDSETSSRAEAEPGRGVDRGSDG